MEEEKEVVVVRISKELVDIMDSLKVKVNEATWNSVELSYVDISKILARKILKSNIAYK